MKIKDDEKIEKISGSWQRAEKVDDLEVDDDTNCNCCAYNCSHGLGDETEGIGNQWIENILIVPLFRSAIILRNILDTWRDLLFLRILVKNHPVNLVWKIYYHYKLKYDTYLLFIFVTLKYILRIMYLPTPHHMHVVTQGHFWVEFNRFEFWVFFLLDWRPYQIKRAQSALLITHSWRETN